MSKEDETISIVRCLLSAAHCVAFVMKSKGAEEPCVSRDGRIFMVGPIEGRVIEGHP